MRLKSWLRRFARGCGISCAAIVAAAAQTRPAIALIDAADAAQWEGGAKEAGWQVLTGPAEGNIDQRVQALAAAVREAIKTGKADAGRIYVAGRGEAAAGVFYAISRIPDLWAAGIALGGSPVPAIETDRIFTANFKNVPVLWVSAGPDDRAAAEKWKAAGLHVEWRPANGLTNAGILEWLGKQRRAEFPLEIDCETNSPAFASCYWIQMTKFDAGERNDVLNSTRLPASSRAALDLGAFEYKADDPGPGVLVSALPPKYSGPLKMGDRLMQLDGKPIASARSLADMMAGVKEEKDAVVTVQRGSKDRVRIETRIVMPRREVLISARVQGQYRPEEKEIQIVSRTVKEMRVTVPPEWANATLNWNGLPMEGEAAGCMVLTIEKELMHAARCQ